jgi:hypothetical protein
MTYRADARLLGKIGPVCTMTHLKTLTLPLVKHGSQFSLMASVGAFHPPIRHGSHHGDELISINAVNVVEER